MRTRKFGPGNAGERIQQRARKNAFVLRLFHEHELSQAANFSADAFARWPIDLDQRLRFFRLLWMSRVETAKCVPNQARKSSAVR
jgi:hypothetical protein